MKIKSIICALMILLFVFLPAVVMAAAVGKLTSVEGKVDITSPGGEAKPAREGDALSVGDIIRSKSKSKCEITFGDGNVLRLAENTRLKITAYLFEKDKRDEVLNLFRGKIQNIVQKVAGAASPEKAGRYEIHTPTSVCGVRGTNFFAFHQSGVSGAIFKEGTGYGYSTNRPQEVRTIAPGQSMVVLNPNLPPVVKQATAQELQQHQKDTAPAEKKSGGEKKDGDERKTGAPATKADGGAKDDKKADAKADDQGKPPGPVAAKGDDSSQPAGNGKPDAGGPPSGAPLGTAEAMPPGGGPAGPPPGMLPPLGTLPPLSMADMQPILALLPAMGPDILADQKTSMPTIVSQILITNDLSKLTPYIPFATATGTTLDGFTTTAGVTFTHTIDQAFLTGTVAAPAITWAVAGTTTDAAPVDTAGGHLSGKFSDGTAFAGYFMGTPEGSGAARGLVRSLYVTSAGGAGFLYGPLFAGFTANAFAGTGSGIQGPLLGTTSIAPAALGGAMDASTWNFSLPLLGSITINADATLTIAVGSTEQNQQGITLNDGRRIGVWGSITNGGTYQNLNGSPVISAYFGKSGGTFSASDAYRMHGLVAGGEAASLLTLSGALDYLDRSYTGTIAFDYDGYNTGGAGGFRGIGAGNIDLYPLAWSANVNADYNSKGLYSASDTGITGAGGTAAGLAGSRSAPWSGISAFSLLGGYTPTAGQGPYVWTAPVSSYNYNSSTNTTYDGGAFFGLTGGVWLGGAIDARLYSLYVSPSGKAGILKGALGGLFFPNTSMYKADGSWMAVELASGRPVTEVSSLTVAAPHATMDSGAGTASVTGSFSGGSILQAGSGTTYDARIYSMPDHNWGLMQAIIGGTYTGTPADTWYLSTDYMDSGKTIITGTENIGSQWSAKKLTASARGFVADITSATPFTWVSAGETVGTFNAATTTWQAAQILVGLDTSTFLTLAQTDAGRATLQQLNIPAIEVGKANLSGNYTGSGSLTVNMNNVVFFANSTGGPPRLWATNAVTGSFDSAYGYAAKTVPLSGNGLTANFNVQTWDTAAGGKWISTVTSGTGTYSGTGSLNNTAVNFRGAAAGTINTGAQTIAGTAAGTAQ